MAVKVVGIHKLGEQGRGQGDRRLGGGTNQVPVRNQKADWKEVRFQVLTRDLFQIQDQLQKGDKVLVQLRYRQGVEDLCQVFEVVKDPALKKHPELVRIRAGKGKQALVLDAERSCLQIADKETVLNLRRDASLSRTQWADTYLDWYLAQEYERPPSPVPPTKPSSKDWFPD